MEIKELRIGNFVFDDYSGDMIVSKIEYATESCYLRKTWLLPDGQFRCKDIKPIPLTEEWLLKFGFEDIEKRYYKERFYIENLFDTGFAFRIVINNAESSYANSVQYVHQLQNLYFALTGNELTL